eukprot:6199819-Pleurochrysis_carterae.AAC.2
MRCRRTTQYRAEIGSGDDNCGNGDEQAVPIGECILSFGFPAGSLTAVTRSGVCDHPSPTALLVSYAHLGPGRQNAMVRTEHALAMTSRVLARTIRVFGSSGCN